MIRTKNNGFTLLELMVTLAVAAILLTVAVPTYRNLGQRSAIDAAANELVATLNYARSEAVKRDREVRVCASSNQITCDSTSPWADGWIVRAPNATGEKLLRVQQPLSSRASIDFGQKTSVKFDPSGFATGSNGSFAVQSDDFSRKTCVVISNTGRVRTASGPGDCPNP